ncbi:MAG: Vms1/Ankzf1 family peptidyl-tRNA hydrolase [Dehalococcoidales bacterium]|nr:Vms1/Ankzf1 family peptidyl-tRNA hydrolase [Dehalococcoidales bacterium]
MLIAKNFKLTRQKILALLDELKAGNDKAISLYLPAGIYSAEIEAIFSKIPVIQSIPLNATKLAGSSGTGLVLFWGEKQKYLISPPFPLKEKYITNGYDTEPLLSLLAQDLTIGIVLVRLGSYSIGVCRGEKLVGSKTGTGLIHSRHRQGGSSAARFQRRRKDQTYHFLERVSEHIREKFEPCAGKLDYLVYGGAKTTILQLQKQCPFLQRFDNRLLPPLLEIPDPRLSVLEKAVTDVWASRVTEWENEIY